MSISSMIDYVASPKYRDAQLVSTDRSILSSRSVEVIPRESSSFGAQVATNDVSSDTLNSKMTFNISDSRHYLDFENSYFKFDWKCRAVDTNDDLLNAYLDEGGIHSCIKTLILRHGSAELHRIDNYNKLYNIWRSTTQDKDVIEREHGSAGDSWYKQYCSKQGDFSPLQVSFTKANSWYDATGGAEEQLLTLVDGDLWNQVEAGDVIMLKYDTNNLVKYGVITRIISSTTCTVDGLGGSDLGSGASTTIEEIRVMRKGGLAARRRIVESLAVASLNTHSLTFKIPIGIMGMREYFPLPFMNQSLELVLEFVEPALAIVVPKLSGAIRTASVSKGATTNKLGYEIKKARFVCRMVEPSAQVFEAHRRLWGDEGLVYKFDSFRCYENQLTSQGTQYNLSLQSNIKSLKSAYSVVAVQADQSASGNRAATQDASCQSTFLKDNMISYRYRIGGLAYPDYGPVSVNDVASGEAWAQLKLAVEVAMGSKMGNCIESYEWAKVRSKKFIMGMLFAKDGSYNSGIDASSNYLELELVYNSYAAQAAGSDVVGVDQALTLYTFLQFDEVAVLSRDQGLRVYY